MKNINSDNSLTRGVNRKKRRYKKQLRLMKKRRKKARMRYIYNLPFIRVVSELDDKLFLKIFKNERTRIVKKFMQIVTRLGDGYIWAVIGLAFFFFKIPYAAVYFVRGLTAVFFCVVTFIYTKNLVSRQRPCRKHNKIPFIKPPDRHSFPSGHTIVAFALAFAIGTYAASWAMIVYPIAILIAYSRIFVGIHYPFDVITSIIVGSCIGILNNLMFYLITGLPIVGHI